MTETIFDSTKLIRPERVYGPVEVVGECQITAYAYHDGTLLVLLYTGAATSVDAVRARMGNTRGSLRIGVPYRYSNTKVKVAQCGYEVFKTRDDQMANDHGLLVCRSVLGVQRDAFYTYIFRTNPDVPRNDAYFMTELGNRIREIVHVAVFDDWLEYIVNEGLKKRLIQQVRTTGSTDLFAVATSPEQWTDIITNGLRNDAIGFPERKEAQHG
jgi:hypothetical protein